MVLPFWLRFMLATSLHNLACLPAVQLSYYHRLFDVEGVLHFLESDNAQAAALEKLAPLQPVLGQVAAVASEVRNGSAYRWVDVGPMFGRMATAMQQAH